MKQQTLTENDLKIIMKVNAFVDKAFKGRDSIELKEIDIDNYDEFIITMFIFMYSSEKELVNYYLTLTEEEVLISYIDEGKVYEVKTKNYILYRKELLCKKNETYFS